MKKEMVRVCLSVDQIKAIAELIFGKGSVSEDDEDNWVGIEALEIEQDKELNQYDEQVLNTIKLNVVTGADGAVGNVGVFSIEEDGDVTVIK